MKRSLLSALLVAAIGTVAVAQTPEIIWYDFNLGDATNMASGSVGNGIVGSGLTFPTPGLSCSDQACSVSTSGSTALIDTQWPLTLGSGDWTVGMHLDLGTAASSFQYMFGEPVSGSFRAFCNGAAGSGNVILRGGPLSDVIITGGASPTPVHVCWVYDSSVPEIRGYLNGVLNNTVGHPALTINGTANFNVMGQNSSMVNGTTMDDFRFYSRAIDIGGVGAGTEMFLWANACSSLGSCPGKAIKYGAGCTGTGGFVPDLGLSGCPIAGKQVTLELTKTLAPSTALFFIGLNQTSLPAGGGCNLYVAPVLAVFSVPVGGSGPGAGTLSLPGILPLSTGGVSFTMQAWVIDPAGAIGGVSTNGLAVTIAP